MNGLGIRDPAERALPCQWDVLARWPDGSVRWALLDFLASAEARTEVELALAQGVPSGRDASSSPGIELQRCPGGVVVDTGSATFRVRDDDCTIEGALPGPVGAPTVTASFVLTWVDGRSTLPRLSDVTVEAKGPVRATLRARGEFPLARRSRRLRFDARLSFFAGTGFVHAEVTLHNPAAARHRGGLWDLGDPGSVLLRDFSIRATLSGASPARIIWVAEPGQPGQGPASGPIEIYQDSSGGENWRSRNHVNREGRVPLAFRGYRVRSGGTIAHQGLRASPVMSLSASGLRLSGAIEQFWENFPKAFEGDRETLTLRLFPHQFGDQFELLGGEQKTHRVWLELEPVSVGMDSRPLEWVHAPLVPSVDPDWYAATGVVHNFVRAREDPSSDYVKLLEEGLQGPSSFFEKREIIDEYGWRHFGDVYADHENLYCPGPRPVISHYNNQYDLLYGLLLQFVRTGEPRWFELARDLARHVIDIDIYHTREDRAAYNGGLFWHTDHYTDAYRAGHRTYSKDGPQARNGRPYGGGPCSEHNYTSGLLLYHYLTGSPAAGEAVLSLARWVSDMDDGAQTVLGAIDPGPAGYASATASVDYHGPGRGAGNSINALADAFSLTGDRCYLAKAEELIARCIHPGDDIAERELENIEARWSYLVFLQVLGKYLDLKSELGERDRSWVYARESLLAYARWMRDHEVPYMRVLDRVEYPTETWPAQDLRKSVVFGYAAKYADAELRESFLEASEAYFGESIAGLSSFETRTCTRPLAILLQNGWMRAAWTRSRGPGEPAESEAGNFGEPVRFERQLARVGRLARSPHGLLLIARRLARPDRLARFTWLLAGELRRRWA